MVGTQPSTDWLATDALLKYFDKKAYSGDF
jgi:hypothetical protein